MGSSGYFLILPSPSEKKGLPIFFVTYKVTKSLTNPTPTKWQGRK